MEKFFLSFFLFLLGTALGSFLNCFIYRLEKGESFLKGRSYCPHCKHPLSGKDLIPIFSFIFLKGKCRYCKNKISIQYPLVEIFSGILTFIALSPLISHFSTSHFLFAIFNLLIFFFLLLIFVFDFKYSSIPDEVLLSAIFLSFLYRIFYFKIFKLPFTFSQFLFFPLLPSLFFLFLVLISKESWLGFGDFEISIFMGLFLGWPQIFFALAFSIVLGSLVGLLLIVLKKKQLKSQIPFAPFLVLGTFFSFFFGSHFIDFYLSLF